MVARIDEAASQGCQVVLFPELSDTGYDLERIPDTTSAWTDEPMKRLRGTAASSRISVIAGVSERNRGKLYNSIAVIGPDGVPIGRYRKAHLFSMGQTTEDRVFAPGQTSTILEVSSVIFGISICYDLRFPELYRRLTVDGAKVLVNCAAWPEARWSHWEVLLRARAIENQAFVIGVNRVGSDAGKVFAGRSCIVSPTGEIVALGDPVDEELVVATIDLAAVDAFRNALPSLRGRRPEVYG
jgi:predicted amidohydrolase